MDNNSNNYQPLYSLKKTNYEIIDGEPDITGWDVVNETGSPIGKIKDLLFDAQSKAVRYLIIHLTDSLIPSTDKTVMIPIGIAHLHNKDGLVVLPNLHLDQYKALPAYQETEIGPQIEQQIREVIGSPAALRLEETMIAFDQQEFYRHHHFDKGKFYNRKDL